MSAQKLDRCFLLNCGLARVIRWSLLTSLALIATGNSCTAFAQTEWRSWRGDQANGMISVCDVPSEWNLEDGSKAIKWRIPLPGPGNSSPIVSNGLVWITQFDPNSEERQLRCYDMIDGQEKWVYGVKGAEAEPTHPTNPYCSASPVTDGQFVVAYFGSAGVFCFRQNGELVWQQNPGSPQHLFGQGASPLIHNGLVTLNYGPGTEQFWITWDLATGEEKWRLEIPKVDAPNPFDDPNGPQLPPDSKLRDPFGTWATAVSVKSETRNELILANPKKLLGVNPTTGDVLWECHGAADQVFCSPVVVDDAICLLGASAMMVRLGGTGDVTGTMRTWFRERDRGRIGSGVVVDETIIVNDMQGIIEAINLEDGERIWQERLTSGGSSESWSSLVRAGDRLFATSKNGTVFVFTVTPDYRLLGTNKLNESTNASPAITKDRIFIRTDKHLWCLGAE